MSAAGTFEGICLHYEKAFASLVTADELSRKLFGAGALLGGKYASKEIELGFQTAADRLVPAACQSGELSQEKAEQSFARGWQKGLSGEGGKPVAKTAPLPFNRAPAALTAPTAAPISTTLLLNALRQPAVRAELVNLIADALAKLSDKGAA